MTRLTALTSEVACLCSHVSYPPASLHYSKRCWKVSTSLERHHNKTGHDIAAKLCSLLQVSPEAPATLALQQKQIQVLFMEGSEMPWQVNLP